ncbi:MAG: tyrosine-protein phosphatase [Oscillospiraceae bacterium]|nr:tyrosine-protein phosphatase [Oscillospiraceae bacterium]
MTSYIRLPLKNAYNVRDLGGYACNGGVTKFHQFIRADGLDRLDDGDIALLKDYGIKTIIDLRSSDELEKSPDAPGLMKFAEYINIPLIPGAAADVTKLTQMPPADFLKNFYLSVLEAGHKAIVEVIAAIAEAKEGGVLFHCAAGKDRTGVIALLILGLAGVSDGDILTNYEVTNTYIRQDPRAAEMAKVIPDEYLQSRRESLEPSLEHINSIGGAFAYLKSVGVNDKALEQVIRRISNCC